MEHTWPDFDEDIGVEGLLLGKAFVGKPIGCLCGSSVRRIGCRIEARSTALLSDPICEDFAAEFFAIITERVE